MEYRLIALALFALLFAAVSGPTLALIALARVRTLRRRLDALQVDAAEATRRTPAATRSAGSPEPAAPAGSSDPDLRASGTLASRARGPGRPARRPLAPNPVVPTPAATGGAPRQARIDWERWFGIRGAAVLGAAVLALAAIVFFKYSIDHGLITPVMRVVSGFAVGTACLAGSRLLRPGGFGHTADGIAGAGVVTLYASCWAAHALYGLIGPATAFVLMALVTLACCLIALRRSSRVVALLGLIGGFATPLLLETGADRPVGLFGYVLLLDLGLLTLGARRRWPSLALMSLVGTVVIESLWIGARVDVARPGPGLIVLGLFALLFGFAGRTAEGSDSPSWKASRAGALLFPFGFSAYFAYHADLAESFLLVSALLGLLSAAACRMARKPQFRSLALAAGVGSLGVVATRAIAHPAVTSGAAWQVVGVTLGLAVLFELFGERERDRATDDGPLGAATVVTAGAFALTVAAAATASDPPAWPWIAGWSGLAALAYRQAAVTRRPAMQTVAAVGAGVGLVVLHRAAALPPIPLLLLMAGASVLAAVMAHVRRRLPTGPDAARAAALLPLLSLGTVALRVPTDTGPIGLLGITSLLGLLALHAATRARAGGWTAAALAATALAQGAWTYQRDLFDPTPEAGAVLAILVVVTAIFCAWPLLVGRRLDDRPTAWRTGALAGVAWFLPIGKAWVAIVGNGANGAFPAALGLLVTAVAWRARDHFPSENPTRRTALAWYGAVALGLFSVAVPMQFAREWLTLGWALEGLAVLWLWRRLDHPGLKYFGLALLGAVCVRLVVNPAVLDYYARPETRIFNWLAYTYLVPAAAMLAASSILRALERARLRPTELRFYGTERPLGALLTGGGGVLVIFVWLNLAIADWFAGGDRLTLTLGSTPAQRLTVSLAWALYGMLLLGAGAWRGRRGLRAASLSVMLITIVKVFLYDLGMLRELWLVASLVGLSVALLSVSLLYQRFVFRPGSPR